MPGLVRHCPTLTWNARKAKLEGTQQWAAEGAGTSRQSASHLCELVLHLKGVFNVAGKDAICDGKVKSLQLFWVAVYW